jgi:hypothetical protein
MQIKQLRSLLCSLLVLVAGCADVQPWQRGNLAKPEMALDPYPGQTFFRSHSYGAREAAQPLGSGATGGGCGCY